MWSGEWWFDAWGDGCSDRAIYSWLLLPLIVARFACLHAYVCVSLFFFFFFFLKTLLCNAVSDLGKKHVPEGYGERAVWMCDHFNLCVILDCTTSYLTSHRAALTRSWNIINWAYPVPTHTYAAGRTSGTRLDGWNRWPFLDYFPCQGGYVFTQVCLLSAGLPKNNWVDFHEITSNRYNDIIYYLYYSIFTQRKIPGSVALSRSR